MAKVLVTIETMASVYVRHMLQEHFANRAADRLELSIITLPLEDRAEFRRAISALRGKDGVFTTEQDGARRKFRIEEAGEANFIFTLVIDSAAAKEFATERPPI